MLENESKLHKQTAKNLLSEFHLDGDIRLRVGNSFNQLYSAEKFDLTKNSDVRINLVVIGEK